MFQLTIFQFWALVATSILGCGHLLFEIIDHIRKHRRRVNKSKAEIKKMQQELSFLASRDRNWFDNFSKQYEENKKIWARIEQLDDALADWCAAFYKVEEKPDAEQTEVQADG